MILTWLLLPVYAGIKAGVFIFAIAYAFGVLAYKFKYPFIIKLIHTVALLFIFYLAFFYDSKLFEELRRVDSFIYAYLTGAILLYIVAFKLLEKYLRNEKEKDPRDILLKVISAFIAYSVITSALQIPSIISSQLDISIQLYIIATTIILGVSAVGIWRNRKWGALVYFALLVVSLSRILYMGVWEFDALGIPFLIFILLLTRFKYMK